MTTNKKFYAFSLAILLVAGVMTVSGIQNIFADDKSGQKTPSFSNKPDFESKTCIKTSFASNLPNGGADANCKIKAWLDNKGKSLKYTIQINGMELIDSDADTTADVYQLHIHKQTGGTIANPTGPHVLNVFRGPGFDDADLVVSPVQGILSGIWDDGDENLTYGEPDNSHKLTELRADLCSSKTFAAVHGDVEDTPGHHAPYLKMVLEPTKDGQKACKKLGF
jgi:hypothetical protein